MSDASISMSMAGSADEAKAAASRAVKDIIVMLNETCPEYQCEFSVSMLGRITAMLVHNYGPRYAHRMLSAMLDSIPTEI